jgi:DNA-directed RNA polymerase subunit RPC12/RpoP
MTHLAHSTQQPDYWCARCELALYEHETDQERERDPYGTGDSPTVYWITCGACGRDVEDYKYQDEQKEQDDDE